MKKRLVIISDTHGYQPEIPEGDILLFAGDYSSGFGNKEQLRDFLEWVEELPFEDVVFVAGNHDIYCEAHPEGAKRLVDNTSNVTMLNNSGIIIDGIKIWGSPFSPTFPIKGVWAFNADRGDEIQRHWDLIPSDTDILITHGPPYAILDECDYHNGNPHAGCGNLRLEVFNKVKPDLHIFGHIHERGSEVTTIDNIKFINASICTLHYRPENKPIVLEYEHD